MIIDPIADMLTRIRNAHQAKFEYVEMPTSRIKKEIAKILLKEGYIEEYQEEAIEGKKFKKLKIKLKYVNDKPAITGIQRVSKPSLRVYVKRTRIPRVFGAGVGISILTTSKGIMTDKEARYKRVGGELLCKVW